MNRDGMIEISETSTNGQYSVSSFCRPEDEQEERRFMRAWLHFQANPDAEEYDGYSKPYTIPIAADKHHSRHMPNKASMPCGKPGTYAICGRVESSGQIGSAGQKRVGPSVREPTAGNLMLEEGPDEAGQSWV